MKKHITYLLLLLLSVNAVAQEKKTSTYRIPVKSTPTGTIQEKKPLLCFHIPLGLIIGYAWQNKHTATIGLNLLKIHKSKWYTSNFYVTAPVSANVYFYNNTVGLYPDIRVVFNKPVAKQSGVHLSLSYWQLKITGVNRNYITPELGISKWNFILSYGYNFFLEDHEDLVFSKHKIALRYYLRPFREKFTLL